MTSAQVALPEAWEARPPKLWRGLLIAALIPFALLTLGLWLSGQYLRNSEAQSGASASLRYELAATALLVNMKDAGRSHRGYALTGNRAFLEPYQRTSQTIVEQLNEFAMLPANLASGERADVERLRQLIERKMVEMADVVEARDREGAAAAAEIVTRDEHTHLMEAIDAQIGKLVERQNQAIATHEANSARQVAFASRVYWLMVALVSLAGFIIAGLVWRLRRTRHMTFKAARDATVRQAALFEHASNAVIAIDPTGRIELLNGAAENLFGYRAADLIGRDIAGIADLAPGDGRFLDRLGVVDGWIKAPIRPRVTGRKGDGRQLSVEVSLGAMSLEDGLHIVAGFRDTSERDEVERMKDQFLSNVSHELRTPLTSIIGALGLLRAGAAEPLTSPALQLVAVAESNATRLIHIVNDLLDVEKMMSGELGFDLARRDLVRIAERSVQAMRGFADMHDATLELHLAQAQLMIAADEERLVQAMTNLLSNAIKFSPAKAHIVATVAVKDGDAYFSVRDNGPGIDSELRGRLFTRFAQGEAQQMSSSSGTGLGLAITREIIEGHGGRIRFEDAPGGGSLFSFTLPLE